MAVDLPFWQVILVIVGVNVLAATHAQPNARVGVIGAFIGSTLLAAGLTSP